MTERKLILGTVQFGLSYGINNLEGKPDKKTVYNILDLAYERGIKILDSAEAYGDALKIIASYLNTSTNKFEVISKFIVSDDLDLEKSLACTLKQLNVKRLYSYMFHRYSDYINNPQYISQLNELKDKGMIKYTGISLYTNEEFANVIKDPDIDLIQIPYNLLDNDRMKGDLIKQAKQKDKLLHVRSVLLQGLFYKDPDHLPAKLKPLYPYLNKLREICDELNVEIGTLAYQYALRNENMDGVIIGVDNARQLETNLSFFDKKLDDDVFTAINNIHVQERELLNPSNWE